MDLRPDRVELSLQTRARSEVTGRDTQLARRSATGVHFDITVAHDEAEARVRAALGAGGRLVDDSFARSFWVLADAEGNEVCVCTWTDRDERDEQDQ
jgi:hypothetical protein